MIQRQVPMQRFNISEGLSRKSLEHLVQPIISIDEFESKISDKRCIVIGFYCGDADPARDLSHFVDRSSEPVLDTEVSPAPTPDGYYVVWVEIQRDGHFLQVLLDLLGEVDNLTNVKQWQFQCPGHDDPMPVNKENLEKNLVLDQSKIVEPVDSDEDDEGPDEEEPTPEPDTDNDEEDSEELSEFWKQATVDKVIVENSTVTLQHLGHVFSFTVSKDIPTDIDALNESSDGRRLQRLVGPLFAVYPAGDGFVVESDTDAVFLTPCT